ncbi:MAG TPA: CRTAC1 family protein [Acidobacteriota bacterium]
MGPFTDITDYAGIHFKHFNDASSRRYLPETMGSGAAFFDYDGDGRPDLYLVNGAPLVGDRRHGPSGVLYRNLGNGKFQDVTKAARLTEPLYGMGVAVGDFDNDGHLDLFITGVDGDRLYRNRGDGTFEDVTRRMGITDVGFGSSAAFLDYDRDGYLDLFVGRYIQWSPQSDQICSPDGVHRTYCTPEKYPGQSNRLYRNLGGKKFQDVTQSSGLFNPEGKTLGIAILDYNQDGWPDLALANDTVRNFLYVNNRDGTFSEVGVVAGMAYSESGATRGGMGIDAADVDGDGYPDLVIANFAHEMSAFYRGSKNGYFVDDAAQAGIGLPTLMPLKFGTLWTDFDCDGWLDLIVVNGHIEPDIAKTQNLQSYAQRPQLFRNNGHGQFTQVTPAKGDPLDMPLVGRGLAAADIDGDGDLDLIITQNGRPARLWRNNAQPHSWLRIQFIGGASNRTGYGAVVRAFSGDRSWVRMLVSGRSYLSACEPVLTLNLGKITRLDRLEITWPSGIKQTVANPGLNRLLKVEEPSADSSK